MNQEQFETGYLWPDYLTTFSDPKKREEWQNGILEVRIQEKDLTQCCGGSVRILVISEDWCGDCREVVPILIKLSLLCPKIDLRIFPRDDNKNLMHRYSSDGKERIPTLVFFDPAFQEIGRWVEYPGGYRAWMDEWLQILKNGRTMKELEKNEKRQFRAAKKIIFRRRFRQEVLDEWKEIFVKVPPMNKSAVIEVLNEIATLLELSGENPFKSRAYENAARSIGGISEDLKIMVESGEIRNLKGIGESIAREITSLVMTGKSKVHEELKKEYPAGVIDMLRIPGLGPKKVKAVYEKLGIQAIGELEYACHENRLSALPGFGEKTQQKILQGIQFAKKSHDRRLIDFALAEAMKLYQPLSRHPKIQRIEIAGSLRRRRETIKDIDILTSAREKDRELLMDFFAGLPGVESIVGKGDTKASVVLQSGMNADLRIVNDDEFAFALMYFTGSKEHNVAMRGRAQKMGYKLNEYDLLKGTRPTPCKTEEDIFNKLGLQYIPPELREDMGELEVAENGKIPFLVETGDLKGTFHNHTIYSDGSDNVEAMALKAKKLGYEYIGISDHSKSAVYANGMKEDVIKKQMKEIDELNKKLKGITIFKGVECDILPDGSLDYSDKVLSTFDFVIASVHSRFKMTEEEMTRRIIKALSNSHVTMLGHATGRLLLTREPYPVNLHQVIDAAAKLKKAIEINSHPQRLDLDWRMVKYAKEKGVKLSINPDAHSPEGQEVTPFGVGVARKGWLEKTDVLNTLGTGNIKKFLETGKT